MLSEPIVILPGLDGSDCMLGEFRRLCQQTGPANVLTLPSDNSFDYPALAEYFSSEIRCHKKCHLIAESFSGPIGILLAQKFPKRVSRLTLVASFAKSPVSKLSAFLPWPILFRLPVPSLVLEHYLVGQAESLTPLLKASIKQNSIATLCHRLSLVRKVNVLAALSTLQCELTYLRAINDRLVPKRCLDSILQVKPDTTVHELAGPHLILESRPENCWRKIVLNI